MLYSMFCTAVLLLGGYVVTLCYYRCGEPTVLVRAFSWLWLIILVWLRLAYVQLLIFIVCVA